MEVNTFALLACLEECCDKDRATAEAVLLNGMLGTRTLLDRIFFRVKTVSSREEPYLLESIVKVCSAIAKHTNVTTITKPSGDRHLLVESQLVRDHIGKNICYPLLRTYVNLLTGEDLPRDLLGYVVVIQNAKRHRMDVDVNGVYLFQRFDGLGKPVFKRVYIFGAAPEGNSTPLYIYFFFGRWQISFREDSPNHIASCRDNADSPELAFEYWVYDGEERAMDKTGGRDLSQLFPADVGISVSSLADAPVQAIIDESGRHFGMRNGCRLQILQLLRRCAFHAEVGRAFITCCVSDPASEGGKLYIIRRFLDMLKTRLNGRDDGKVVFSGGRVQMNLELREMTGFALNMMSQLTTGELEALVCDLEQGAMRTLEPVLLLLCDIFTASVQTCIRDSEIPRDQAHIATKYPWIAELKIPVNWGMAPPVAITSHITHYVEQEAASVILPFTVKGLTSVADFETGLTPENKWLSALGHDVLHHLDIPIAFCEVLGRTSEHSKISVHSLFEYMSPMDVEGGTTAPDFRPNVTDRLLDMCLQATLPGDSPGKVLPGISPQVHSRMNSLLEHLVDRLARICENARNAALVARREVALEKLKSIFVAGTETKEDIDKTHSFLSSNDRLWIASAVPALFRFFLSMCMHIGGMHQPFSDIAVIALREGYETDPLSYGDIYSTIVSTAAAKQRAHDHSNFIADIARGLHQADPIPVLVKVFKVESTQYMREAAMCLLLLAENSAEHRETISRVEGIKELTLKGLKMGVSSVRRTAAFALYRLLKGNRDRKIKFMSIEGPEIIQRLLREELQHKRHRDLHLRTALQMMLMELATNLECASRLMGLDVLQSVLYTLHHVDVSTDEEAFVRDIQAQALARAVHLFHHLLGHPELSDQIRNTPEFPSIVALLKEFYRKIMDYGEGNPYVRGAPREPSIGAGSGVSTSSRGSQLQELTEQERADDKRRETKQLFRMELHKFDLCARLLVHRATLQEKQRRQGSGQGQALRPVPPPPVEDDAPPVEADAPSMPSRRVKLSDPDDWRRMNKLDDVDEERPHPAEAGAVGAAAPIVVGSDEMAIKPSLLELTLYLIDPPPTTTSLPTTISSHGSYCGCAATSGRKHVMISYAWGPNNCFQPFAVNLAERLRKCRSRFGVWLDVNEMTVGDSIVERFKKGVRGSACVIMLLSKSYANSNSCQSEASTAFRAKVPVIPLLLEPYESDLIDGLISGKLHQDVKGDCHNNAISQLNFRKVVKAIKQFIGPPTDYPRQVLLEEPPAPEEPVRDDTGREVQLPASVEELLDHPDMNFTQQQRNDILRTLEDQSMADHKSLHELIEGGYSAVELMAIGLKMGEAKKLLKIASQFAAALQALKLKSQSSQS